MAKKKIAVLTSGGDAPGMNAAVRAVVRSGIYFGFDVYGVNRGYSGLIEDDIYKMNLRSVSNIIGLGGTMLRTSRSAEFATPAGIEKAAAVCRSRNFDGLIVIGGDGSFRGALDLSKAGIPCIGIPGTIDNDIACTEYTIGFDTAINTAVQMTDKIRDTTVSHDRCCVIEVMGRHCGDIAIQTALAVGAFAVLVPEIEIDFEKDIIEKMREADKKGKKHFIIVVAEGVGNTQEIAYRIRQETGFDTTVTILGYVQRGGAPSQRDRTVAGLMGYRAVELLKNGEDCRVVVMKNGAITDLEIGEALSMKRVFDRDKYKIARRLSI
ncbi:MAG: 6-phosphofructokinase [Clostridia bacterium]|nr:6-phosphofructokinase [Clostridia bacterium]